MAKWIEITSAEEWNSLLHDSSESPVFLFKHSTTCPISAAAWSQYLTFVQGDVQDNVRYRMVKVIESRPVSNQIAADLNVQHASPQAILIHNRQSQWTASHYSITTESLTGAVRQLR